MMFSRTDNANSSFSILFCFSSPSCPGAAYSATGFTYSCDYGLTSTTDDVGSYFAGLTYRDAMGDSSWATNGNSLIELFSLLMCSAFSSLFKSF